MSEIFNKKIALEMVGDDSELLSILVQAFLSVEFSPEKLNELVLSKKNAEAASYVHRVKGAARQLAMEKLAQTGQKLEDVLREKNTGEVQKLQKLIDDFCECYDESLKTIQKEAG